MSLTRNIGGNRMPILLQGKLWIFQFLLIFRLRETFRSTIRDATKSGKVRDMVRYVKRPRSAIERHAYKESRRNSTVSLLLQVFILLNYSEDRKLSSWKLSRFAKNFRGFRNPRFWPRSENFRGFRKQSKVQKLSRLSTPNFQNFLVLLTTQKVWNIEFSSFGNLLNLLLTF